MLQQQQTCKHHQLVSYWQQLLQTSQQQAPFLGQVLTQQHVSAFPGPRVALRHPLPR
jgi:hypothetical protein